MADRLDYYFRQRVTEAELDLGFDLLEQADRNVIRDIGIFGVVEGLVVTQKAGTPDLSVDVSGPGLTYDQAGQRMSLETTQNIDVSLDLNGAPTTVINSGHEKIVSLFVKFERRLSDPRTDGNNLEVFFRRDESIRFVVRQGGEAPAGTAVPPPLQPDEVLLADVTRSFGQTQILNAALSPNPDVPGDVSRRQDFVLADASAIGVETPGFDVLTPANANVQATLDEIDDELNDHFTGVARRHPATAVDFAGGPNWADGTTNPARTVEAQLDDMLAQLGGGSGASRLGTSAMVGSPAVLLGTTIAQQLQELLGHHNTHLLDTSAHDASALAYAGAVGAASSDAPVFSAPASQIDAALDFLLGEVNKRVAKAGDAIAGGLSIATGLDVGFAGSPVSDRIRLGDADFRLDFSGTDPRLFFHTNDYLQYVRSGNRWEWFIASVEEMQLDASGLSVTNDIVAGGALTAGSGRIYAGSAGTNYVSFASSAWDFYIGSANEMRLSGSGLAVQNGLFVGDYAGTPSDDCAWVGDANFGLDFPNKRLRLDANDYLEYDRTANELKIHPGNTHSASVKADGIHGTAYKYLGTHTVFVQYLGYNFLHSDGPSIWASENNYVLDSEMFVEWREYEIVAPIPMQVGWSLDSICFLWESGLDATKRVSFYLWRRQWANHPDPWGPGTPKAARGSASVSNLVKIAEGIGTSLGGWWIIDETNQLNSAFPWSISAKQETWIYLYTDRTNATVSNRLWKCVFEFTVPAPWSDQAYSQ